MSHANTFLIITAIVLRPKRHSGIPLADNVRELESVIERAVIISQGTSLQILDRFDAFRKSEEEIGQDVKALAELEHDHVLQKTGWRIEEKNGATVLLGLNASTLRARMRKYGITRQ